VPRARVRRVDGVAGQQRRLLRRAALHLGGHRAVRRREPDHPPLDLRAGGSERLDGHDGEIADAQQPEGLPGVVLRGLPRRRDAGPPAQPRQRHLAAFVRPHQVAAVAGHLPVVEAVRQHHHVGGEAVAAEMAALPHVHRPRRRQCPGQRPAAQRAAGVMAAVRAHQVGGPGSGLPHRAVPGGGQEIGVRGPYRPPQPLASGPAVAVRPAPPGVGQPLPGKAHQQQAHVLRPCPPGECGRHLLVEPGLAECVPPPGTGLLDQHPPLHRRGGGDDGVAPGQRAYRAPTVVEATGRAGRRLDAGRVAGAGELLAHAGGPGRLIGRSRVRHHGAHRAPCGPRPRWRCRP
jgi:hypothetical protein